MENDFQIVNHEIQYNADICAALRIWREAMRLTESWTCQTLFKRAEHRIKPFHVADLQNQSFLRSELHQLSRFGRFFRDRFFNQQVFSAREQLQPNLEVRPCWRGDRGGIYSVGKLVH